MAQVSVDPGGGGTPVQPVAGSVPALTRLPHGGGAAQATVARVGGGVGATSHVRTVHTLSLMGNKLKNNNNQIFFLAKSGPKVTELTATNNPVKVSLKVNGVKDATVN